MKKQLRPKLDYNIFNPLFWVKICKMRHSFRSFLLNSRHDTKGWKKTAVKICPTFSLFTCRCRSFSQSAIGTNDREKRQSRLTKIIGGVCNNV